MYHKVFVNKLVVVSQMRLLIMSTYVLAPEESATVT